MLILVELVLTVIAAVLAFVWPQFGSNGFAILERLFSRLARKRKLSLLVVGLAALAARAAVLPILPAPQPTISDEFSHLLAADTFARGRLTNPTPPMWIHFETFHVILKPTYMSMYPPGQDLLLALGEVVGRSAFVGMWLGVGMMCAAICWMLQGWFPPEWALLGGFLAVIRFGVFSYWANSYWGGAVAAAGGALVLGALPRITRFVRAGDALWMGLGLAILANTRPYEGLIFSLPAAFVLFAWLGKKRGAELGVAMRRAILPLALVAAIAAVAMGYYNWRVTGDPIRMPQQVDRETYAVTPYFLWESPLPAPVYHHPEMRNFYLHNEFHFYEESRTLLGLFSILAVRYSHLWVFYIGPALTLPFLLSLALVPYGSPWQGFDPKTRFLILTTAVSLAGLAVEVFFFPHYAAPMTCLILALAVQAMRRLRNWQWRGKPSGRFATRAVPAVCLLMLLFRASLPVFHLPVTPAWPEMPYNTVPAKSYRAEAEALLDRNPGQHLVLVQNAAHPGGEGDWVYNGPDIDRAKTIWAWDMGPAKNEELIRYFKNRDVWFVERDVIPPRLMRYLQPANQ